MSDLEPKLPAAAQEELLWLDQGRVRSLIGSATSLALSLYGTAKEKTPESLRTGIIDPLEAKVQPLRDPILAKWKEQGEPLVDIIDATLEDNIVPQAKAVEQKVAGAVTLVHGKVQQVQQTVDSRVVKPCVQTKDQIVLYTHHRKNEAVEVAYNTAERAIDYVLPDFDNQSNTEVDPLEKAKLGQQPREKLTKRLSQRASFVSEVVNELSFKYLPDEESTSLVFFKVIEVMPTSETSERVAETVVKACPPTVAPLISKGFVLAQPALDFTFDRMMAAILLTRKLALSVQKKPVLVIEDKPTTEPKEEENTVVVATTKQHKGNKKGGQKPTKK